MNGWSVVGQWLVYGQEVIDVNGWRMVGQWLVNGWPSEPPLDAQALTARTHTPAPQPPSVKNFSTKVAPQRRCGHGTLGVGLAGY